MYIYRLGKSLYELPKTPQKHTQFQTNKKNNKQKERKVFYKQNEI